jgi:hypothetical protein
MMVAEDGRPEIDGPGKNPARTIGVRTSGRRTDIEPDENGMVHPSEPGMEHGMSASPPPPEDNLQEHRRPLEYGGIGKDPVWELETEDLPPGLVYTPDHKDPKRHGLIGPSETMSMDDYLAALYRTRNLWRLY